MNNQEEIIQLLFDAGGKCIFKQEGEEQPFYNEKLSKILAQRVAGKLQRVLGVTPRVAATLASAPHPTRNQRRVQEDEVRESFENGRLPCSFSTQLLWSQARTQLDQLDQRMATKRAEIAKEQQKRLEASQGASAVEREMEKLHSQIEAFQEAERTHAGAEKALKAELEELKECQELDVAALKLFVHTAAEVERELVFRLEAQLESDMGCLLL